MNKYKVLIVGGGVGGLKLATILGKKMGHLTKVTLIDPRGSHIWKPILHKLASGGLEPEQEEIAYQAHSQEYGYEFIQGSLLQIRRSAKQVIVQLNNDLVPKHRTISYDYLVIALGSQAHEFGTPGVRQFGFSLDSAEQAVTLRTSIETHLAAFSGNDRPQVMINIVGAGASGTELASALADRRDPSGHLPCRVRLIELSSRILNGMAEKLSRQVRTALDAAGVEVLTDTRITEVTQKGVYTSDGLLLGADLNVWCAGVKSSIDHDKLDGLATDMNGRIIVKSDLATQSDFRIFAIGDCCVCVQPDGTSVPTRALAANQMAEHLYENMARIFSGADTLPFYFKDQGTLVTVTNKRAYGVISPGIFVDGRSANMLYSMLYKKHQQSLIGWRSMLKKSFISFSNNVTK